ncbi:hypothetical protein H9Y04_13325 [Streptomyces sp. TRM66268-LWL]|uniref:WXG100 family type VII secretion target n=1 Tax=Streptomyces polyasparticus TaxID=2767826 RepID=A0ABR7SDI3_9ACTN|nr:hypothetical protein [Streptomyces polyasparticus]MBC9713551.1 hypothetical protein [Streptomyces polyasparticus]
MGEVGAAGSAALYPNLGFDPVPGNPGEISALQKQVAKAAKSLGTAHELVDRLLRSASSWQGEGGDAFRRSLSEDLPRRLLDAHKSLSKASGALLRWHDGVVERRVLAQGYEDRARSAASALRAAEGRRAEDPEGLSSARDAVGDVLRLARELEGAHAEAARAVSRALDLADDGLAPEEPGALDKVVAFLEEDLGDYLSVAASVAGLAAVMATAPVGVAIALTIAATSSAGAFALHLKDPQIRDAVWRGFTEGKLDAKFWDGAVTLVGDGIGALPGIGLAAGGAKGAVTAVRAAGSFDDAVRAGAVGLVDGAKATGLEMATVTNRVTDWALHSAGTRTKDAVEVGIATTGVATSVGDVTPLKDEEVYETAAPAVDGARIAVEDIPSNFARVAHAATSL